MPVKITYEKFIEKAIQKYGNTYDYSLVNYENYNQKIIIICPVHGNFEQTPNLHINSKGNGCNLCSNRIQLTTQSFIEKAKRIHENKYDYTLVEYKNNSTKIKIICPVHGEFEQKPNNHISAKQGCSKCSGNFKHTTETVIQKLLDIHQNRYQYVLKDYSNNKQIIDIMCSSHGVFQQKINTHMAGRGCPSCKSENSGWTRLKFKKHCDKNNNGLGIFYIIRCFNENEEFYKIGITSRSIEIRYQSKRDMPYNYEIVQKIETDPIILWDFELMLKGLYKNSKYTPLLKFPGCLSECFKM